MRGREKKLFEKFLSGENQVNSNEFFDASWMSFADAKERKKIFSKFFEVSKIPYRQEKTSFFPMHVR